MKNGKSKTASLRVPRCYLAALDIIGSYEGMLSRREIVAMAIREAMRSRGLRFTPPGVPTEQFPRTDGAPLSLE